VSLPDAPALPPSPGPDRASAKMRRQLGLVRALTLVSLVLVIVLAVWSVVGILALTSQVSSLEAKVDALSARVADGGARQGGTIAPGAQSAPTPAPSAAAAAPATGDLDVPAGTDRAGAIVVGDPDAAKFVEVYVDYQCPYCQRWETEIGTALMERALQPGSGLAVRQYNMAFLGEASRSLSPPGASARAASAAACVLDVEGSAAFVDFNAAIFATLAGTDPASRFDTATLTALAAGLGASDQTLACIDEGRFIPFVAATTQAAFARGVTGTPTVLVNGKPLQDAFGDAQLLSLLRT
jgi:protein-disulfide isomerase